MKTLTAASGEGDRLLAIGSLMSYRVIGQLPESTDVATLKSLLKSAHSQQHCVKDQKWFKRYQKELEFCLQMRYMQDKGVIPLSQQLQVDEELVTSLTKEWATMQKRSVSRINGIAVPSPAGLPLDSTDIQAYWGLGMSELSFFLRSYFCTTAATKQVVNRSKFVAASKKLEEIDDRYLLEPEIPHTSVAEDTKAVTLMKYKPSDGKYNPIFWHASSLEEHEEFLRGYLVMHGLLHNHYQKTKEQASPQPSLTVEEEVLKELQKFINSLASMYYEGFKAPGYYPDEMTLKEGINWSDLLVKITLKKLTADRIAELLNENRATQAITPDYEESLRRRAAKILESSADPTPAAPTLPIPTLAGPTPAYLMPPGLTPPPPPIPAAEQLSAHTQDRVARRLIEEAAEPNSMVLEPFEIEYFSNWMLFYAKSKEAPTLVLNILKRINHFNQFPGPRYTLPLLPGKFYNAMFNYCAAQCPEFERLRYSSNIVATQH